MAESGKSMGQSGIDGFRWGFPRRQTDTLLVCAGGSLSEINTGSNTTHRSVSSGEILIVRWIKSTHGSATLVQVELTLDKFQVLRFSPPVKLTFPHLDMTLAVAETSSP